MGKIRAITGIFDSDWDKVPNDRDCVWYDRKRQHYTPKSIGKKTKHPRFFVKSTYYPEAKLTGERREKQTDVFLQQQESEDINRLAHRMFMKDFTELSEGEKETVRRAFIWGW